MGKGQIRHGRGRFDMVSSTAGHRVARSQARGERCRAAGRSSGRSWIRGSVEEERDGDGVGTGEGDVDGWLHGRGDAGWWPWEVGEAAGGVSTVGLAHGWWRRDEGGGRGGGVWSLPAAGRLAGGGKTCRSSRQLWGGGLVAVGLHGQRVRRRGGWGSGHGGWRWGSFMGFGDRCEGGEEGEGEPEWAEISSEMEATGGRQPWGEAGEHAADCGERWWRWSSRMVGLKEEGGEGLCRWRNVAGGDGVVTGLVNRALRHLRHFRNRGGREGEKRREMVSGLTMKKRGEGGIRGE